MEKVRVTKTETMTRIDVISLIYRLLDVRGTTFVSLTSRTEPKMNKRNNPLFGNVEKVSTTNCIIGYNYENMVNNARKRELATDVKQAALDAGVPAEILKQFEGEITGIAEKAANDFEAKKRQWGKHYISPFDNKPSRILIEHTPKDSTEKRFYVQVAVLNTKTPTYYYKGTDNELSTDDLVTAKSFMPKRKEGERQELKNPIIVRDYRIDNVKKITLNKSRYEIKH